MTIYEIDSQILECIDEETGEVLDIERLEKLMQDKENKIEAVALRFKKNIRPFCIVLCKSGRKISYL